MALTTRFEDTYADHKAEWEVEANRPDESWPSRGEIEFRDYSVKYRDELDLALKHISAKIGAGEKVRRGRGVVTT